METLRHPFHEHDLKLCLVHEKCTGLRCDWCRDQVQGPAYYCKKCDLFFHKSCAKLPLEIQHPFHQQHALQMGHDRQEYCHACQYGVDMQFRCLICSTRFCFSCIIATIPDEDSHKRPVDGLTAHHWAHGHPLAACHLGTQSRIRCKLCMNTISGEANGCYECFVFMHENCAGSQQEVKHPFHVEHPLILSQDISDPSCDICDPYCTSTYSCLLCDFKLCFNCAVSTMDFSVSDHNGLFIGDRHPLKYFHVEMKNQSLHHDSWEKISGETCGCTGCVFFLHKSSTQLPLTIKHLLRREHSLELLTMSPDDSASLDNCFSGLDRISSYACVFHCRACEFVLDVKCALETSNFLNQRGSLQIGHHLHNHPLQLCYWKGSDRKCSACVETVQGLAYECNSCFEFLIHRSCAELPSKKRHPCHAQHEVNLHCGKDDYTCNVCFKYNTGIRFLCEKCDFYLDIPCAYREPTVKNPLHEHKLSLFDKMGGYAPCKDCGKSCNIDVYRCFQCNFFIHRDCLPELPTVVKHEKHVHQLTLEEVFNDPEEDVCEFCEKARNPELGVYCCKGHQWTLAVHPKCALSEDKDMVRKILKITERDPAVDLDESIKSVQVQLDSLQEEMNALREKLARKEEELRRLKEERAKLWRVEEQKQEQEDVDV